MKFEPLSVSDRDLFCRSAAVLGQTDSESAFTTVFLWKDYFKYSYLFKNNTFTLISGKSKTAPFHTFPLGDGDVKTTVLLLRDFFLAEYGDYFIRGLTEKTKVMLEELLPDMFEFEEKRAMEDYVYNTADLINLPGKKYHAKRNHLNKFLSAYNWTYKKIDETNIEKCAEFVRRITAERNPDPYYEIIAMNLLFENYFRLGATGGFIEIDGQIAAVSVGEKMGDTALIQVEKADTAFDGAYAAINQIFLKNEFADTRFVNREEDMGVAGLRKAKMSYHPAFLYKKYIAKPIK